MKSLKFFIPVLLTLTLLFVAGSVSAASPMDSVSVSFSCPADRPLVIGDTLSVTATISGAPDKIIGSCQWWLEGVALPGYYNSMFDIYDGRTSSLNIKPTFKADTSDVLTVWLDIAYDGTLKRYTFEIPVHNYTKDEIDNINKDKARSLVSRSNIEATVLCDTDGYSSSSLSGYKTHFKSGETVYYKDHSDTYSALVERPDGTSAWIKYQNIRISNKNYTVYSDYADDVKESFVNLMNYKSDTPYLLWVNLQRQKVNVFLGEQGNWKIIKTFTCATGANTTPTPEGEYKYCGRDNAWIKPEYIVRPVLYFNIYRGLALHSRLYSPYNGALTDATMGRPVSHGCIRMMDDDIRWLEYYLAMNSRVVVY